MEKENILTLNAVVLFQNQKDICPVVGCGGDKNIEELVCEACRNVYGDAAKIAIYMVKEAVDRVAKAASITDGGWNKRGSIIDRPVFAQIKIRQNALLKESHKEGVPAFHEFNWEFVGEDGNNSHVPIYAFGLQQEDLGTNITALIDIKQKVVLKHSLTNYIRVEKVFSGLAFVKSSAQLYITPNRDMTKLFIARLPEEKILNHLMYKGIKPDKFISYYIGFSKI